MIRRVINQKFETAVNKVIFGFELILLHFSEELRSIGRVTQEVFERIAATSIRTEPAFESIAATTTRYFLFIKYTLCV